MTETVKANDCIEFTLAQCCTHLSQAFKSEVIFIKSPIYMGLDDAVRIEIEKIVRNKKGVRRGAKLPRLTVVLETTGGYIEVVERICNIFRKHFREVDFIVPSHAYSAGTVLVLSGDRIFMDYYSVLGPIDPQIQDDKGKFVPGMGYLYKYNKLVEKSKNNKITNAELLFLTKRFDPAVMFVIEQAKNHSEELIKKWLPKYKFKNWNKTESRKAAVSPKMKQDRAAAIAEILGNAEKWHSHGRGIAMRELRGSKIKLKIDDFGADKDVNQHIRQYYDLLVDYCSKLGMEYATHTLHGLKKLA